jgi:hypothetical protein
MPVLPFSSDADIVQFAKAFLDNHVERFQKDIAICLTLQNGSHAYFPALMACIAFGDLLSGLFTGKLNGQKLPELEVYVSHFMDAAVYTHDRLGVLYECFRHKVAHLAHPYVVFDTTKSVTFKGHPKRLITWEVHDRGPSLPIEIVSRGGQISASPTPWDVLYDHIVIINLDTLASDIVNSIPRYLQHLQADNNARSRFKKCMQSYFPR